MEILNDDDYLDQDLEAYKNGKESVDLKTHEEINHSLCGYIERLDEGYVEVRLETTENMIVDKMGLIHSGFVFSAADYAAMLAINEKNVVLVGSDSQFLVPVKVYDEIIFKAKVRHKEGRKRNVHVEGFVLEIKVFEGEFKTVITDRHILKMKLIDMDSISKK